MTDDELEKEFIRLATTGEVDRILRGLRNRYFGVPREVVLEVYGDANAEVVLRNKRGQKITNVAGLLTTIAGRKLRLVWDSMQREQEALSALELRARHPEIWRHDEEHVARVERAARFVRKLAVRLDNENYRRTLMTLLDAAQAGVQLENKELGEILGCAPNTAGMWKIRAFQRLRPLLEEAGISTWEGLILMGTAADDEEQGEYAEEKENGDERGS